MRSIWYLLALPGLFLALAAPAADPLARLDAYGDPLPTGALARLGTIRFRDGNFINAVAVAPDGKSLAVAGLQAVRILDLATGKELRALKSPGSVNFISVNYSPGGKLVGAADSTGRIQFWDPATGEAAGQVAPADAEKGVGRTGSTFTFSGDGKSVVLATDDFAAGANSRAAVYEVATGKQTAQVALMHNNGARAFLSGDGKVLATTGYHVPRGGIEPFEKQVEINSTVELWDTSTGKELHKLRTEGALGVSNVAFSPDGKEMVVATAASGLVTWDPATGKELRRLAGRRDLSAFVAYSPDGNTLAAGSPLGAVQTWDAATGKRLGLYEVPRTQMTRVAFTKAGRLLACGSTGQAISVWDVLAEESLTPTGGHGAGVTALGFMPDGKGLVSASWDGAVSFWDAAGKENRHVQLHPGEEPPFAAPGTFHMSTLQLSPDRKHVLGSFNNGLSLYELGKGREVCAFSGGFTSYNPTAMFSADGSLLLEGLSDTRTRKPLIRLCDVGTGRELRQFEGQAGDLRQLALAPDGKTVAAAISNFQPTGQVHELRAWEATTGKSLWHVDGGQAWLQGLAFSPDGKVLAAMDAFGAVTFHEAADGRVLRRLPARPGTTNPSALTYSPDGRLLAVAAYDSNARKAHVCLFEVAAGAVRHEFVGHDGPITALAFAADRKRMATGGNDTTVLLWDLTGGTDGETAKGNPSAEELADLWEGLANADARAGFKAMRRLEAVPEEAVALLAKHVKPAWAGGAADAVAKLIAALDDDSFDERQAASKELTALGKSAEGRLKKALAAGPSAEAKRAIEDLLEKMKDKEGPPTELVRPLRAVEVLEDLGTPEARKVLESLSKGRPEATLTVAAKEALARLDRTGKP
ncbi:MAG TPA: PQQ-binding-like beta-propeller repeat protein [Gemmataceae bacterium]|nr:PQQ-binding-like beta-propeller repeat protein [Gemmataceae bacterium]